jgi:predicted nucleic acid-binding protein
MPNDSTVFVDTNVLLYAVDPRVPGKQAAAQAWLRQCWQRDCGRISTQVLHELYANLRRVAPSLSAEGARQLVREYRAWTPWVVDEDTVDTAWQLQDRFDFPYWDALMVAAAQQQGCMLLLTEDLQHDLSVDRLRILNPFVVGPDVLDTPTPP